MQSSHCQNGKKIHNFQKQEELVGRRGPGDRESVGAQVAGMENKQRDKWSARLAGCCEEDSRQNKAAVQLRYLLPTLTFFCPLARSRKEYRERRL